MFGGRREAVLAWAKAFYSVFLRLAVNIYINGYNLKTVRYENYQVLNEHVLIPVGYICFQLFKGNSLIYFYHYIKKTKSNQRIGTVYQKYSECIRLTIFDDDASTTPKLKFLKYLYIVLVKKELFKKTSLCFLPLEDIGRYQNCILLMEEFGTISGMLLHNGEYCNGCITKRSYYDLVSRPLYNKRLK